MADDFRKVELLVIYDAPSRQEDKIGSGVRLSVIQWVKGAKQTGEICVAKLNYWVNENDQSERFKIKALTKNDFTAIGKVWKDKILPLMENPPAVVPAQTPEEEAADRKIIEEVPF